jgi:thiamine biosynthesis lipoprotein
MSVAPAPAVSGSGGRPDPRFVEPRTLASRPDRSYGPMRVDRVMGTVVTIDVRDPGVDPVAVDAAFDLLRRVDARFSPFRPDSDVSRVMRGEVAEADTADDLRLLLALCEDLRRTSGGAFDIRAHRPDGRPDPTGIVKGWAVEEASRILDAAGASSYVVSAGGDIVARGEPEPGVPWRVGIRHPDDPDRVAAILGIRDAAVATSGAYERGGHIVDPSTGRPTEGLLSVTVVGPSLTLADAYATAVFAMGLPGVAWAASRTGYDVLGITAERRVFSSAGIDRLIVG